MNRWLIACSGLLGIGLVGCGGTTSPRPDAPQPRSAAHADSAGPDGSVTADDSELLSRPKLPAVAISDGPDKHVQQSQEAFARLIQAAEAGDPSGWRTAEEDLQQLGALALPALVPALKSAEPLHRELAVTFLAQLGPEAAPASDELAALLLDESPIIRVNAAAALSALARPFPASIDALTELVAHEDAHIRETAISALGNAARSPESVLPVLASSLSDDELRVRIAAAVAIGQFGTAAQSFATKLRLLSADEDPSVRNAVTTALELIETDGKTVPTGAVAP